MQQCIFGGMEGSSGMGVAETHLGQRRWQAVQRTVPSFWWAGHDF